jgi:hypothetical protein
MQFRPSARGVGMNARDAPCCQQSHFMPGLYTAGTFDKTRPETADNRGRAGPYLAARTVTSARRGFLEDGSSGVIALTVMSAAATPFLTR